MIHRHCFKTILTVRRIDIKFLKEWTPTMSGMFSLTLYSLCIVQSHSRSPDQCEKWMNCFSCSASRYTLSFTYTWIVKIINCYIPPFLEAPLFCKQKIGLDLTILDILLQQLNPVVSTQAIHLTVNFIIIM